MDSIQDAIAAVEKFSEEHFASECEVITVKKKGDQWFALMERVAEDEIMRRYGHTPVIGLWEVQLDTDYNIIAFERRGLRGTTDLKYEVDVEAIQERWEQRVERESPAAPPEEEAGSGQKAIEHQELPGDPPAPEAEGIQSAVLEIISEVEGGMKLSEIGRAVGRSWQSLIPVVQELMEAGVVIKDKQGGYHPK